MQRAVQTMAVQNLCCQSGKNKIIVDMGAQLAIQKAVALKCLLDFTDCPCGLTLHVPHLHAYRQLQCGILRLGLEEELAR
jgi:hypothetical protein